LLDPWFFLYFYLAPPFQEFLRSRTIPGATVDRIALKEFPSFPIVLPPMVEQRRIVSALRAIDDKIELNRRMNETLEAMARTIFKDWFVDFGPTRAKMQGSAPYLAADIWALFPDRLDSEGKPDGWQTKPFLDSTSLLSGGTPKTDRADFWGGEIAWASAKDVSQCGETFLFDTERCITDAGLTGSSTRMIPAYATVVVARGATTGRFCMSGQEMAMNQTCYALKSKNDHNFWTNCAFAQLVEGLVHAAHGSVFDTITTDTFQRTSFINDDRAKDAFEVLVRPLFTRISANIADNRSLAATRDLLLPKLISGEVSIRDAKTKVAAAA
jgi:type I restriction enzyme S subunit